MRKIDIHKKDLQDLLSKYLETLDEEPLIQYFIKHSNLPGRRGNLEMAGAFDALIREKFVENLVKIWELSIKLTNIAADEAPTNNPKEMIPFCGTRGLGAIGSISEEYFDKALRILRGLANDTRWRMREAVAAAIGRMLTRKEPEGLTKLETWIEKDNWLEMRAIATGIADACARDEGLDTQKALEIHKKIFSRVRGTNDRKNEQFKVLVKGLCYTLSVVTQVLPEEGFSYMAEQLEWDDSDITRIVKENLKKNRLKKKFPKKVSLLTKRIS